MVGKKNLMGTDNGDGTTTVVGNCVFTGEEYSCTVPTEGLARFLQGEHAQTAMPTVSADDREFLISGISPAGWTKTFGPS
jgi:hypothetical protein